MCGGGVVGCKGGKRRIGMGRGGSDRGEEASESDGGGGRQWRGG